MNWAHNVGLITPYIVKIETPDGHGTGFLYFYNENRILCAIATAAHVVSHADKWQQPIRILRYQPAEVAFLKESERAILINWGTDSAVIIFLSNKLTFPTTLIPLLPSGASIDIGEEVAWLGFPAIEPNNLCFFSGNISARQESRNAYLIDGVAIHGVSGGPVIYKKNNRREMSIQIVGTVNAYQASRAGGDALPGLLIAQDVSHFHSVISTVNSIDEANRQKIKYNESQQQQIEQDPEKQRSKGKETTE